MEAERNGCTSARAAILATTTELIEARGVAGTSIADIVAGSGTSAGAIYHHFGSKENLIVEVGREAMAGPLMRIMATSVGISPADLFAAALAQVAGDNRTSERLFEIWSGAKHSPGLYTLLQAETTAVKESLVTVMRAWCAENAPHQDPEGLANIIMGLITGYAVQRALNIVDGPEAYRELGVRMLEEAARCEEAARA